MATSIANYRNFFSFSKILSWFENLDNKIQRNRSIRQTIKELSALSDHELKDIGISRSDIRWIATSHHPLEPNENLKDWV